MADGQAPSLPTRVALGIAGAFLAVALIGFLSANRPGAAAYDGIAALAAAVLAIPALGLAAIFHGAREQFSRSRLRKTGAMLLVVSGALSLLGGGACALAPVTSGETIRYAIPLFAVSLAGMTVGFFLVQFARA